MSQEGYHRNLMPGEMLGKPLSPRENEVLGLMAEGLLNKEIASTLGTTEQTVKNQITSVLRKTGTYTRTGAVTKYRSGETITIALRARLIAFRDEVDGMLQQLRAESWETHQDEVAYFLRRHQPS